MSNFLIDKMSFRDVETHLKNCKTVIIPIGGLEPIGEHLPLGAVNRVVQSFAESLSKDFAMLQFPVVEYGFATPFKDFEGVTGVRKDTFINIIADVVRAVAGWGVEKILFIDGTIHSKPLIDEAFKRFQRKIPDALQYDIYTWQHLPVLRKELKARFNGLEEYWRSEAAITLLYEEVTGFSFQEKRNRGLVEKELFTKWKKRGMDPSKLRGYAQRATLSKWDAITSKEPLWPLLYESLKIQIRKNMEI